MSSSNRAASPTDAVVKTKIGVGGPLLMPSQSRRSFVKEFNRIYRSVGLSIQLLDTADGDLEREPARHQTQIEDTR